MAKMTRQAAEQLEKIEMKDIYIEFGMSVNDVSPKLHPSINAMVKEIIKLRRKKTNK